MDGLLDEVWSDKGLAGKYLFERQIAASSMAVVVAARHLELEERVAIKFLSPDAIRSKTAVSRFRSEAKTAAKIKSHHVVRIIDVATTANNTPYIVMEYLDGKDLEELLGQFPNRRAPVADAVDFILQASEAVSEGHSLGIVHRDLKPANLFCVDRGDGYPLIKVLDFGISKFTGVRGGVERTDRHEILGSPRYMSPEQIESASTVDPRTDIWSLGVILYEALAGKPPFDDDLILRLWRKIKEDHPEPIPAIRTDCPTDLWEAVTNCLQKDPAARFADLGDLARALAPFAPERSRPCIGRIRWLTENNKTSTIKSSLFTDSYDRVSTNPTRRRHRWMVAGGIASTMGIGLGLLATRGVQSRTRVPVSNASPAIPAGESSRPNGATEAAATASSAPVVSVEASATPPTQSSAPSPAAIPSGKPKPPKPQPSARAPSSASMASPEGPAPVQVPSNEANNAGESTPLWVMQPVKDWK